LNKISWNLQRRSVRFCDGIYLPQGLWSRWVCRLLYRSLQLIAARTTPCSRWWWVQWWLRSKLQWRFVIVKFWASKYHWKQVSRHAISLFTYHLIKMNQLGSAKVIIQSLANQIRILQNKSLLKQIQVQTFKLFLNSNTFHSVQDCSNHWLEKMTKIM